MDKIELLTPIAGIIAVIIGVCLNIIAIHLPELEMNYLNKLNKIGRLNGDKHRNNKKSL